MAQCVDAANISAADAIQAAADKAIQRLNAYCGFPDDHKFPHLSAATDTKRVCAEVGYFESPCE